MSTSAWIVGGVLLATLGAEVAWAQVQQGAAGGIYTCVDKHGRRLTADRPIPECLDREQRELSPSGMTRRQIGPSLTELERAAQDAQRRKAAEERVRIVEERRRDRVLVARYPDKAAHDLERAELEHLITESDWPAPEGTTGFDSQVGFAIRRHCAPAGSAGGQGARWRLVRRHPLPHRRNPAAAIRS